MSIKKVKITKVYKNEAKQDGTPYQYKTDSKYHKAGEAFTRIGIQTEQTGDETYYTNASGKDRAMNVEEGQVLLLDLTESASADGTTTFKNFGFPSKDKLAAFALENA